MICPKNNAWMPLTVAILFIIIGIAQGEPAMVLAKAIRICLECVGIG